MASNRGDYLAGKSRSNFIAMIKLNDKAIAMEVPEGATDWKISGTNYLCFKINGEWQAEVPRLEDFVKWQILGLAHELTETQCRTFMPYQVYKHPKTGKNHKIWYDYRLKSFVSNLAHATFQSLMEVLGLEFKNSYGEEPKDIADLGAYTQMKRKQWIQWNEAQQKVKTYLILIKNE